jgi:methylenetetrahydrofolate dehydrogenase (NADP+)/methenyltetrahydrofolate cyclohydrolase
VGAPLEKMWTNSGFDVTVFRHGDDLSQLRDYDVIVSATGVPHLIKNEQVRGGSVIIDAGTASEDGVLVGDVDDEVRERTDLAAITPRIGGVGPLTVGCLFEHVINA